MRYRGIVLGLTAVAAMLPFTTASQAIAQIGSGFGMSGQESMQTLNPMGPRRPDLGGFYGAAEFLFMHGNRNIGNQLLAIRGFTDSDGSLTGQIRFDRFLNQFVIDRGVPGTFVGSRAIALDTSSFGRTTWTPGFRVTFGYKLEDETAISLSYLSLQDARYNTSATVVPPGFNVGDELADAFLYSPVFNFSPEFGGPQNKVQGGSGLSPYGIWNGATQMDIKYNTRFANTDITVRVPVAQTEYARSYALSGFRHSWIWERFSWLTISRQADGGGGGGPDQALYTNIISQRMYGPFVGTGNEIYMGDALALSGDVTGSVLYAVVKERAKYELGDSSSQSKRGRMEYTIVPNIIASLNLWWYPIEGVSVRFGYTGMAYFNTIYMNKPVGFNVGAIDPAYLHRPIRFYHGIQFGVGITF